MSQTFEERIESLREDITEAEKIISKMKELLAVYDKIAKKPNNNSQQT